MTYVLDHDDRQVDALELAALLHRCASLALVADRRRLKAARIYAQRIVLELDDRTGR